MVFIHESGESSLVGKGIRMRIGRLPVQTPLGAWPGLGTQSHYKAPGDLRVENENAVINIR